MRNYMLAAASLTVLGLAGCGSEPPAFQEKPAFALSVLVDGEAVLGDDSQAPMPSSGDVDAILQNLDGGASSSESNDAVADDDTTPPTEDDDGTQSGDEVASSDEGTTSSSGPASGGSAPGGDEEWVTPDFSRPSKGELKACAEIAGVSESRLKIAGSRQDLMVQSTDVLVAKIVGNQNRLVFNLDGGADARLAGICLFVAGNQASVEVKTGLKIARIFYTARGNQSHGVIQAHDAGDVEEMVVDLSGNEATADVTGVGSCPTPRLRGHAATFNCSTR